VRMAEWGLCVFPPRSKWKKMRSGISRGEGEVRKTWMGGLRSRDRSPRDPSKPHIGGEEVVHREDPI